MIDPSHPVRVVNQVIDSLDLDLLIKKYKGGGCSKAKKLKNTFEAEKTIWNDELEKFYGEPVPVEVWEKFKLAVIEDETENITEEEMQNIAEGVNFDHIRSTFEEV